MRKLLLTLLIAPPVIIVLLGIVLIWYHAFAQMSENILEAWGATYLLITVCWLLALAPLIEKLDYIYKKEKKSQK